MTNHVITAPEQPTVPVLGQSGLFPVRRIFCVGRNYAEHAAEMGNEVDREAPFYFTKSAHALVASGSAVPYPPGTQDFHHEMELVVALKAPLFRATPEAAMAAVYGYASGLDMTRRDLQAAAKDKRRPWDTGKDFENAAVITALTPAGDWAPGDQPITLSVNGAPRQAGKISDMVWSVPEILCHLSTLYHLQPGDLIYTGTPAGVGAVVAGDQIRGEIAGLETVSLTLSAAE